MRFRAMQIPRKGYALALAAVVAVLLAVPYATASPHQVTHGAVQKGTLWKKVAACFMQRNWILSVESPEGGFAYARGGGEHFQETISWWVKGQHVVAATDSGLLTRTETRDEHACLGPGAPIS